VDPQIDKLNRSISDLLPVRDALQEAEFRISKNFPFSLSDIIFGAAATGTGEVKFLPAFTGSVVRASKSPRLATRLIHTGETLQTGISPSLFAIRRLLGEGNE